MPISASQGGTISLPDGTSVTIPGGLLSADTTVTLTSNPNAAPPPIDTVIPASSDITLSFGAPLTIQGRRNVGRAPRSVIDDLKFFVTFPASYRPAIQSGGLMQVKLHLPNVGFNFLSPNITVDSAFNRVASSLPPPYLIGADYMVFTVVTQKEAHQQFDPITLFLGPDGWVRDSWTRGGQVKPRLRTLIMLHGILDEIGPPTGVFPAGYTGVFPAGCALQYKQNGNYGQVLGYTYDWTRPPKEAGAAFLRLVNSLDVDWVDIQAHSYGTVVALQALPDIKPPVKNMILIAGPLPLNGVPQVNDLQFTPFLRALALNLATHNKDMAGILAAEKSRMIDSLGTGSQDLRDIVSRLPQGQSSPRYLEYAGTKPFDFGSAFKNAVAQIPFHKPFDGVIETRSAESGDINPSGVALGKFRRDEKDYNHYEIPCASGTMSFVSTNIDRPPPGPGPTPTPPGPTPTPPGPTPTPPGPTPTPPGPTPTPPGPTPTPPGPTPTPPSGSTTSRYMATTDATVLYNEGCAMGQAGSSGIVVLDFGRPSIQNNTFGTQLFGGNRPFASLAQIATGVEGYLDGYFNCSRSGTSELRLAAGTDNSFDSIAGNFVTSSHGAAWGQMVNTVNTFIANRGYGLHQFIRGAIDIRPRNNTYAATKSWVEAFHGASSLPLYNYGAADGCNSAGTCDNGWTAIGVWYVSNADFGSYPLPLVVNAISVDEWYQVSVYSAVNQGGKLRFLGTMTAASVFPGSYTPAQGFQEFQNRINSDTRTAYPLQYPTDITRDN